MRRIPMMAISHSDLMHPVTKSVVAVNERFAKDYQVPVISFHKGQRKDDVMKEQMRRFDKSEGVEFSSKAQKKTRVFRTERRRNAADRATLSLDCTVYRRGLDRDFGPFLLKFCSYSLTTPNCAGTATSTPSANCARKGSAHQALDNEFVSCADSARLLWFRQSRSPRANRGAHRAIAHHHHPRQDDQRPAAPLPARHDQKNP
jgi:hypothetical protein